MSSVVILLSTYNGEQYLESQLNSIYAQSYKDFEIVARDDYSSDETNNILKFKNLTLIKAKENLGVKKSFGVLLNYALENSNCKYFMFADQDDIWNKNKIEKTLFQMQKMEKEYPDSPLLVHTDLKVVDENLNVLDNSFYNYVNINQNKNTLNRLLMHNTIVGCTMMINRKLAEQIVPIPGEAIMHDWYIGLVASQFGKIGFVKEPTMLYRQHSHNDIGAKRFGLAYTLNNAVKKESILKYIIQANKFLEIYRKQLDDQSIKMLEDFSGIENKSFIKKIIILFKYKLFKQGAIRNIGLLFRL